MGRVFGMMGSQALMMMMMMVMRMMMMRVMVMMMTMMMMMMVMIVSGGARMWQIWLANPRGPKVDYSMCVCAEIAILRGCHGRRGRKCCK